MSIVKCSTLCLLSAVGVGLPMSQSALAADVTTGWLAGDYDNDGTWEVSESDAANFANSPNAFWNGTGSLVNNATNFANINAYVSNPLFEMSRPGDASSSYEELLGAAASQANASWEVVFRPGDFTGDHVVFETGGSANGTILRLFDNTLNLRFQNSNTNGQEFSIDLSTVGAATDFFHVSGAIDVGASNAGSGMYVNGVSVGAASLSPGSDVTDWVGGDGTGLGKIGGGSSAGSLSYTNLGGDVAVMRHYNGTLLSATEARDLFIATTGNLTNPTMAWEAADYDGNGTWEVSSFDSNVAGAGTIVFHGSGSLNTGDTNFANVNSWLSSPNFNQGIAAGHAAGDDSFDDELGGSFSQQDTTIELAFRPGNFTGKHVLYEVGGNGDGVLLKIDGSTLTFVFQSLNSSPPNNNALTYSVDLASIDSGLASDFYHIVGVMDMDSPNDLSGLYVNGTAIGSVGSVLTLEDWAGGDGGNLGVDADSTAGGAEGGFSNFDGDLAFLRLYGDHAFDQTAVDAAYNAVVPEPSSLALLGLGGLALIRRRRG